MNITVVTPGVLYMIFKLIALRNFEGKARGCVSLLETSHLFVSAYRFSRPSTFDNTHLQSSKKYMLSIGIDIRISNYVKRTSKAPLRDPILDKIYCCFQNNRLFCSIPSLNTVFLALK
jgi:hypothetical protein